MHDGLSDEGTQKRAIAELMKEWSLRVHLRLRFSIQPLVVGGRNLSEYRFIGAVLFLLLACLFLLALVLLPLTGERIVTLGIVRHCTGHEGRDAPEGLRLIVGGRGSVVGILHNVPGTGPAMRGDQLLRLGQFPARHGRWVEAVKRCVKETNQGFRFWSCG